MLYHGNHVAMPDLIHQFISQAARHTPEAAALLFKDQSLSYAGLQQEIDAAANGLLALGVARGERVARSWSGLRVESPGPRANRNR